MSQKYKSFYSKMKGWIDLLRKFLLVLTVLLLVSGAASAQDQHIGLRLTVHYDGEESILDADILFGEDETLLFSGLFPSYVISAPPIEGMELRNNQDSLSFADALSMAEITEMFTAWAAALQLEEEYGVFAGDLFDAASVKQTGKCSLNELFSLFLQTQNKETGLNDILSGFELPEEDMSLFTGIRMDYSVFDSGKYFTIAGKEEDRTVFTASFDFSDPAFIKMIAGHAENGKNYYWAATIASESGSEMKIHSALLADEMKTGYRSVAGNSPIITEDWGLTATKDKLTFSGIITPANELDPILLSGFITAEKSPGFYVEIRFGEQEDSYLSFSAFLDEEDISAENKTKLMTDELTNTESIAKLSDEAGIRTFSFYMKLIQILPEAYLNILTAY